MITTTTTTTMVLNNVTTFHRIIIKTIQLRDQTSLQPMIFHKLREITLPGRESKIGNVMQQTVHSYVCGINLRSESSLVFSDLHFT